MSTKIDVNPAINVARYFAFRANFDGEIITPLRMQKLVYYAYVWVLIKKGIKLFKEKFQAWPNGPVLPSLYQALKIFKNSGIDMNFIDISNEEELDKLKASFSKEELEILDKVYEKFIKKSAFELVALTHNENPWKNARKGLSPTDSSVQEIQDKDIIETYGTKA